MNVSIHGNVTMQYPVQLIYADKNVLKNSMKMELRVKYGSIILLIF
jgi:hypothetical protein